MDNRCYAGCCGWLCNEMIERIKKLIMRILYGLFLTLHILSFITAMGTVVLTLFAYRQFWRLYAINVEQGRAAFRYFLRTGTVGMIGLFAAILAGLSMEFTVSFAHAHFTWFKVKMFLVLLLFVNGFTRGRVASLKLQKLVAGDGEAPIAVPVLTRECDLFIYTQLAIYLLIVIMVAFRFA